MIYRSAALAACLWSQASSLSEDWFDDVMKQSFPHVQSVMSVVMVKPDPCEVAVKSIQTLHNDDDMFEEMFESFFPNPACQGQLLFSPADEEECMAIQSSPEVEEMVASGIDQPQLVCGWRKFWMEAKDSQGAFDSCELCERTVQMIENSFQQQELAIEIVDEALKLLCQYLPESTKCKTLVTNFDNIVKWLKEGLSPHNICQKVSMCTAHKLSLPASRFRPSIDNDDLCAICRDNAIAMQSLVGLPHGVQLYKGGLDSICALAPETATCRFMSTHFHKLAAHLKRGDSADSTCRAVHACHSTEVAVTGPTYLGCIYCEFVGQVVTSALHQGGNETLPYVRTDVAAMCSNLPASAQCDQMDEKFDEFAKLMAQGKTPEAGCEAINMCSPLSVPQTADSSTADLLAILDKLVFALDKKYDLTHYVACSTCEHTAYAIERVEKHHNGSLPTLKKAIKDLCHFLPPCTKCHDIVSKFDNLVGLIEKGTKAKPACVELGFCQPEVEVLRLSPMDAVENPVVAKAPTNGIVGCIFCQYTGEMISEVAKYSKDVVPLLKMGVETLCTRLPSEAKCSSVVDSFDALAADIEAGKSPLESCQDVKLCDAQNVLLMDNSLAVTSVHALETLMHSPKKDDVTCASCEAMARAIDAILKYNKNLIPVFKMGMEVLCERFHTSQCVNVMPQFDRLVELIESGKSFLDACDSAKLCGANALVSSKLHDLEGVALKRSNDDVTCEMCEAVSGSIFSLEKYNKQLIPVFKMGLEVLCDRLQTPQCIHVMPEFDHLVDLVENGKNFLEACDEAKLCGTKALNPLAVQKLNNLEKEVAGWMDRPATKSSDELSCMLCEYTGEVIDQVAQYDKDVVPFLKQGIESLCPRLPVQTQCEQVVTQFDTLAELIEAGTAAPDPCIKVQLCGKSSPTKELALPSSSVGYVQTQLDMFALKMRAITVTRPNDVLTCLLCEDTALLIRTIAQYDKDVVPLLKTGLATLCSQVPQLEAQCNAVVDKFDSLASLIEAGTDPSEACSKTKLCEIGKAATLALESKVADWVAYPESAVGSDEGCLFCQYASESIRTVMKLDKKQLPVVREAIGAMCSFLPPTVHCDDVNEHFEQLTKSLESGSSPLDACHGIALCDAPEPSAKMRIVIDELMATQ
ncbi:unnamed protein product [Aphanomyces euteiches]